MLHYVTDDPLDALEFSVKCSSPVAVLEWKPTMVTNSVWLIHVEYCCYNFTIEEKVSKKISIVLLLKCIL